MRHAPMPFLRRAVLAAVLTAASAGLLAGCGGGKARPRPTCPKPAIIDQLASFERYRPGAVEAPETLAYRAALENIEGTCGPAGNDLAINLAVEVLVEPGPAFQGPTVEVPYFVAVLGPGGNVVDRQDYLAKVTPASGVRRAASRESFQQRFAGLGQIGAAGYQIVFGFTLPQDEAMRRAPAG